MADINLESLMVSKGSAHDVQDKSANLHKEWDTMSSVEAPSKNIASQNLQQGIEDMRQWGHCECWNSSIPKVHQLTSVRSACLNCLLSSLVSTKNNDGDNCVYFSLASLHRISQNSTKRAHGRDTMSVESEEFVEESSERNKSHDIVKTVCDSKPGNYSNMFIPKSFYECFLRLCIMCMLILNCVSENTRECLDNCTCSTYSFPGASSSKNLWPSMLTASLLSQVYPVPLKNPTTLDSVVNSILSAPADDNANGRSRRQSDARQKLSKQRKYFSSVGVRQRVPLLPGEVFANCYDKNFAAVDLIQPIVEEDFEISNIVKMDFSNNRLTELKAGDLIQFYSLKYLFINNNSISNVEESSLPESIVHLSLRRNRLSVIPNAFRWLDNLKILDLANNQLVTLASDAISALPSLALLSLHNNHLVDLHPDSLNDLPNLQILDLAENQLASIPKAVRKCKGLRQLLIGDNKIIYVEEDDLHGLVNLQWIDLQKNKILDVHVNAFSDLPSLLKIILDSTQDLDVVPNLNGTHRLDSLRIGRADLETIPGNLCENVPKLRSLYLPLNHIQEIPDLSSCSNLRLIGFSNNEIRSLGHAAFAGTPLLHDLHLQYNLIEHVPEDAFLGLANLQVLNMEFNKITTISPNAFIPLLSLEDINLGNNVFPELPSIGLEHVVHLKAHNNKHLREFPGPQSFPAVHTLALSYAYHCCPFLSLHGTETYDPTTEIQERVVFTVEQLQEFDPEIWNQSHVWPHMEGIPTSEFLKVWANSAGATSAANNGNSSPWTSDNNNASSEFFKVLNRNKTQFFRSNGSSHFSTQRPYTVQCIPRPGPFMPCRDLFDWWTLRCGVWIVFLLSLMGNGIVVVVLVSAYSKMDVPRFLVTNLAIADFFMGIYLGILAVVDASTLGDFRKYAIPWQLSPGCQLAGFLGVLSSELSVYTLAVITMERNYAITHAMHLNKRLSLKHASYIMLVGWIFSLTMAMLPLSGVSDYRKFAVCLPFETDGAGMAYVVFLMVINGVAFFILMCCYLKIYCAIRGSQAWNSNDSRIAKRMALLVFTDFICWAPIAFFALSAVFGLQLLSLDQAKVMTVFVLPLNSCCNPFLYALLTKQFKKDCVILCKAIEESRVTRGIGRCRHSSNFSNRQTPANTNSALDQNSKEDNHSCSCRQKESKTLSGAIGSTCIQYLCCHTEPANSPLSSKSNRNHRSPLKVVRSSTLGTEKGEWNWRGPTASTLRLLELRHQNTMDLARKSSQESSLSSSRNDSSGTSGSTMTWRISRSSVSSDTSSSGIKGQRSGSTHEKSRDDVDAIASKHTMSMASRIGLHGFMKPRLERQRAIDKDPGHSPYGNELRCPLHSRADNLSCVYEQASLEEEDSNDVFTTDPPVCVTHKRSLSDGILCGTVLSLSAPAPQFLSNITHKLPLSRSLQIRDIEEKEASSVDPLLEKDNRDVQCEPRDSSEGLLETHFPVEGCENEVDPLLRRKSS